MSVRLTRLNQDGSSTPAVRVTADLIRKVDSLTETSHDVDESGGNGRVPVLNTEEIVYLGSTNGLLTKIGSGVDGVDIPFDVLRPPSNSPWGALSYYYDERVAEVVAGPFGATSPTSGEPAIHTGSKAGSRGGVLNSFMHWIPANRMVKITASIGGISAASGTPTKARVKLRRHTSPNNAAFTPAYAPYVSVGTGLATPNGDGFTLTGFDVLAAGAWAKYSLHATVGEGTGTVQFHGPIYMLVEDCGGVTSNIASRFVQPDEVGP